MTQTPLSRKWGSNQSATAFWQDAYELSAELKRARATFLHLGDLDAAREILAEIQARIKKADEMSVPGADAMVVDVLRASVGTLLGQISLHSGDVQEAQVLFRQAAHVWQKQSSRLRDFTGDSHADYGVALEGLGQSEKAGEQYQRAVDRGTTRPEPFQYLGMDAKNAQHYDRAIRLLEKAVEFVPEDAETVLTLVDLKLECGQLDQARPSLQRSSDALMTARRQDEALRIVKRYISLYPDEGWGYARLGMLLAEQGSHDEALEQFQQALQRAPDDSLAISFAAQLLRQTGQREEAIGLLRDYIDRQGGQEWVHLELGNTLIEDGDHEGALAAFNEALKCDPGSVEAAIAKGNALLLLDRDYESRELLEECVRQHPENRDAHLMLAKAELESGRQTEALGRVDQVLAQSDDDPFALYVKQTMLSALGQDSEAIDVLDRLVAIEYVEAGALLERGDDLLRADRLDAALLAYNKAARYQLTTDQKAQVAFGRGESLRLLGHYEESLRSLAECRRLRPDDLVCHRAIGFACLALRQYDAARVSFQKAVELAENAPVTKPFVYADMAFLDRATDNFEGAFRWLELALKEQEDNAWALVLKGELLSDIAEFKESLQTLEKAAAPDSGNARVWANMGWALENLAQPPDEVEPPDRDELATRARQSYQHAIDIANSSGESDSWYRKGLANSHRVLRETELAAREYNQVLVDVAERGDLDSELLALCGWCRYQLGDYDEATRLFMESIALNRKSVVAQFDLALSLLAGGRYQLAHHEYERGVESMQRTKPPLRQRGLLFVARRDLNAALRDQPALHKQGVVANVKEVVDDAWEKVSSAQLSSSLSVAE